MNHRTSIALFVLSSLLLAPAAVAHDVYVDRGMRIYYGHLADGPEPYPADKVTAIRAFDGNGKPIDIKIERRADMSYVEPARAPAILTVDFDNGLFAKTPAAGKFQPGGREQFPDATEVRRFIKAGKTILRFEPAALDTKGMKLEITPVGPVDVRTATMLEFEVRYDGAPLAGATLIRDDAATPASAVSDASGRAKLPFDATRDQLYTTRNEVPGEAGVDKLSYASALLIAVERTP